MSTEHTQNYETTKIDHWLDFLQRLADFADEISRHYFQKLHLKVSQKTDSTPVTQADLEIEERIRKITEQTHPDIDILGEEFQTKSTKNSSLKLIIDPIDGTQNFIRGIPFFATLLAIEEHGKIIAGVISSPIKNDRWWAGKNTGSFYNKNLIKVSKIKELTEAQAFHGSLYGYEAQTAPPTLLTLLAKTHRQRGFGDFFSHMLVAMGCGEFAVDFGLKPWDIAPIKIIIEEAGGKCTDIEGKSSIYTGSLLSSNKVLHKEIKEILNNA